MKKICLLLLLFTIMSCEKSEDDAPEDNIPEENEKFVNIPDLKFKNYFLRSTQYDINGDGEISYSEAEKITFIDILVNVNVEEGIVNLTGLESFINLTSFKMSHTDVTFIDFSKNQKLNYIYVVDNKIEEIKITTLPELKEFHAQGNSLKNLDLTGCEKLERIDVARNNLISLNVKGLTELEILKFNNNEITDIDLSTNSKIYQISCYNNNLSTLNVSNMTGLEGLSCGQNPDLTTICVYDKTYAENSSYFYKPDSAQWVDNCP